MVHHVIKRDCIHVCNYMFLLLTQLLDVFVAHVQDTSQFTCHLDRRSSLNDDHLAVVLLLASAVSFSRVLLLSNAFPCNTSPIVILV
jgi:hypothetical protein